MMKILQVGGLAGPGANAGGVWSVAKSQTKILRTAEHEVTLFGGWLDRNVPFSRDPIFVRLKKPFPGAGLRGLYSFKIPTLVRRLGQDVDIAHIHLARDFLTTISLFKLHSLGIPIIVQSHGMISRGNSLPIQVFDMMFRRRILSIPKFWLTLSDEEERRLRSFGVDSSRIIRTRNSAPRSIVRWENPKAANFSFISRLQVDKQPDVFVKAAILILKLGYNCNFNIAGPDQGELKLIQKLIIESGYEDRFSLLGSLSSDQVLAVLSSSTAVVLPSRSEISPMIILEAASVGTPIIVTKHCGLANAIGSAAAGLVISPEVDGVFQAMRDILNGTESVTELSGNASRLFDEDWSEARLSSDLESAYVRSISE